MLEACPTKLWRGWGRF